ncbi:uracil-DNA glycosylase [Arthrobacter crusticola]|uniref:uracil-DNA glycosylase n=1 Tax=Arthrobacter crusticola TaxID=2547960 RepID=UPI00140496F3|nr:uracil-DNA glycosylase [Arthrobacter crusticola]
MKRKLKLVDEPHVRPLNDWVRSLNHARTGSTADPESTAPWFDPSGGGVNARVLFLLEAPGSRSSASRGSGFISIDNNDATAANLYALTQKAGLDRATFALWNIVPWYLPEGTRTKATKRADTLEAGPHLESFVELFTDLDRVVTMGTFAREGWEVLRRRSPGTAALNWTAVPHPSATNLNTRPHHREQILHAMQEAGRLVRARR